MYDITQTKRPSGQNVDNLILIRYTISFQKSLSPKFPGRRKVAPMLAHGLQIIDIFFQYFCQILELFRRLN